MERGGTLIRKEERMRLDNHFSSLLRQADSSLLVEGAANSARLLISAKCITARLRAGMCHGLKLASCQCQSGVEQRLSCHSLLFL